VIPGSSFVKNGSVTLNDLNTDSLFALRRLSILNSTCVRFFSPRLLVILRFRLWKR